jgi:hypothetical protein
MKPEGDSLLNMFKRYEQNVFSYFLSILGSGNQDIRLASVGAKRRVLS